MSEQQQATYTLTESVLRRAIGRAANAMSDTGWRWTTDETTEIVDHILTSEHITPTPADGVEEAAVAEALEWAFQSQRRDWLEENRDWEVAARLHFGRDWVARLYPNERKRAEAVFAAVLPAAITEARRLLAHGTAPEGE